jgi:hypothetical protein
MGLNPIKAIRFVPMRRHLDQNEQKGPFFIGPYAGFETK